MLSLEGNARKLYVSSGGANVKLKLQFDYSGFIVQGCIDRNYPNACTLARADWQWALIEIENVNPTVAVALRNCPGFNLGSSSKIE
jgi:hypothetical protein